MAQRFDLTLTDEVRRECLAFLDHAREPGVTLVLLKGKSTRTENGQRIEDPVERWYFAGYGPAQREELEAVYAERGLPLIHEIAGLIVAIPQPHLLSELQGRTLTRESSGLAVVDRNDGI